MIGRRRRGLTPERRTLILVGVAGLSTAGAVGVELSRVWRHGSAPLLTETDEPLLAAAEAVAETAAVAASGYRQVSVRENALFNLLTSYVATFVIARVITTLLRRRSRWGPFRNVQLGKRHIHHFVPGILLAFVSGSASLISRNNEAERWLALVFGAGMGLTMDESALLLELEDVYWTEEGLVSVEITSAVAALLAALVLAMRFLRRGEQDLLPDHHPGAG